MSRIGLLSAGCLVLILGNSALARAGASPVSLGEVKVEKRDPALEREFRGVVVRELDRLDLSSADQRDRFVLSAALVTMTTRERSGHAESVAVVSATLRRARGGALHAIIQGRAQVTDDPKQQRDVELSAMRAAVRKALARVPEAIK